MKGLNDQWRILPLNKVCKDIIDCINKTAPTVDYVTDFKMIRTTNVKNGRVNLTEVRYVDENTYNKWTRRSALKLNDVILTREAPLGEIGLLRSNDKVFLGQRTMVYRANGTELNQHFLYYSFLSYSLQAQIKALGSGSTVEHLRVPHAETLKIILPPLPVQKKIAAILSAYDDLIENNNRRIAILEKMAEELYREWFVRMRFPGHEKVKIIKGVPEGWEIVCLGDITELAYGKALKEEERMLGEYPVYGSSGVVGYHNKFLVKGPGIVVGRKGNVGSLHWSDDDFYPIDTVYFVKTDISLIFMFYLLQKMNFINNDAAVPGLNRKQAYSNKIIFPKQGLIKLFTDYANPIFLEKNKISLVNSKLKTSRDCLLTRLMSGKLDVEKLDIKFPKSMLEAEEVEEVSA